MGDHSELKRSAETACSYNESDWFTPENLAEIVEHEDAVFISAASPFVVSALIAERDQLKAENERLRLALESCADELEGQVVQCYHGQPIEDMHPVVRRSYDQDMCCVAEARAAMGKGEQS